MKKVTAFVICLLLMVNVLGIEAFAADTVTGLDVSLVENKSFVEIGGKEIRVDKLEKNGCKLVLTPVMWMGQYHDQAGRPLTESYEELKKIPTYDAADDHFVPMAGRNGIALDKLTVLDFFHATVVRMDDGADVTESAKLTLTFSVPYASGIQMVLNQLPNDPAWNAVSFTADPGQITVTAGGRGRYAFLIPEGSAEQLLRGNSGRMDEYVPSAEQKGIPPPPGTVTALVTAARSLSSPTTSGMWKPSQMPVSVLRPPIPRWPELPSKSCPTTIRAKS